MLALKDGSSDAFEELFGRYRTAIWGYFWRRLSDSARAEELAQEAFVAVLEGAGRYEQRALFRTYLYGIAFNLLSAERRKRHNRPTEPLGDLNPAAAAANPDSELWVKRALAQLEPSDREIVLLREYEQLSYAEIAELTGLSLNTVRTRLFRARLELRRLLMPEVEGRGSLQ